MPSKELLSIIENPNLANNMDKKDLAAVGNFVKDKWHIDTQSRQEWLMQADEILELCNMNCESRYADDGTQISSAKYPLITTAVMQYTARTYPEIVRDGKTVLAAVLGKDADGSKTKRAERVSNFMSFQTLIESDDWEVDTDKLLTQYACVGTGFKKTWFDPIKLINRSKLISYKHVIVNHNVPSLEEAQRITHEIFLSERELVENVRYGLYREEMLDYVGTLGPDKDYHEFLEQHTYYDHDDDGYPEPYIITVHKESGMVARMVARFDPDGITYNGKGKVIKIDPVHYFTDFHCIPNPDGGFYSLGIGSILLHSNEVVNSLLRIIIDASAFSTMQGGIFGADLDIPKKFKGIPRGQWIQAKAVDGRAIKDQVHQISYAPPSPITMALLEFVLGGAKESLSFNDSVMSGNMGDVQNMKSGVVQVLAEEGKKVLTAMQHRLWRSFKSEYEKLYRLNRIYLDEQKYLRIMDDPEASIQDFEDKQLDIRPVSDPSLSSTTQRLSKAQAIGQIAKEFPQFMEMPEVIMEMIKSLDIPKPERFISDPTQQQPDPKQVQLELDKKKHEDIMALEKAKLDQEAAIKQAEMQVRIPKIAADVHKTKVSSDHIATQSMAVQNKAQQDEARMQLEVENAREQAELQKITLMQQELAAIRKNTTDLLKIKDPARANNE